MLGDTAVWLRLTEDIGGAWIWQPEPLSIEGTPENLQSLRDANWHPLDDHDSARLALVLTSQLAPLVPVVIAGKTRAEIWADRRDIAAARAAPVVLAFPVPDLYLIQARPDQPTENAIHSEQVLPPAWLGALGIVVEDARRGEWATKIYSERALDEDGQALRKRLDEAIRATAGLAQWPQGSRQLQTLLKPGGYEASRQALAQQMTHATAPEDSIVQAALDEMLTQAHALRTQRERMRDDRAWWEQQWEELHQMAADLAATYWQRHLLDARKVPDIADAFTAGDTAKFAEIPSSRPVWPILQALSEPRRWSPTGPQDLPQGLPTATHAAEWLDTILQMRSDDLSQEPEMKPAAETLRALWDKVNGLGDEDVDVFLDMLAQAYAVKPGPDELTWITAARILDDRNIKRKTARDEHGRERTAGHRQEDMQHVGQRIARISSIWITLYQWEASEDDGAPAGRSGKKRRGRRMVFRHDSRLVVVSETITQRQLATEQGEAIETTTPAYAVAWGYRIGTWLDRYLGGQSREFAWLCQQALAYDPYRQMWEKRLARYFVLFLRIDAARHGGYLPRKVGTLLDELGLEIEKANPERTRTRLEKALNTLVADGVIAEWQYVGGNPKLPARGWVAQWRECTIQVVAPPIAIDRYQHIKQRTETLRAAREVRQLGPGRKRPPTKGNTKGGKK